MRIGSLFSGVGGFDLGLEQAGHEIVFQCESNRYCQKILRHHWPNVPLFDDVRKVNAASWAARQQFGRRKVGALEHESSVDGSFSNSKGVDLLAGGFPCQDLSVAGKRAGLAGAQSGLFFEFARVADELLTDGGWVLIENVPGLLSSNDGKDFAVLLATMADLGFHDLAYRTLDSRYFGVPQRRRRVFILARRSVGECATKVLLEPESGGGNFAPRAETREKVAGSVADGARSARSLTRGGNRRFDGDTEDFVVNALDRRSGGPDDNEAQAGHIVVSTESAAGNHLVSSQTNSDRGGTSSGVPGWLVDPRPDSPRYAVMGNAVTVPVARWVGERLRDFAPVCGEGVEGGV